MFLLGELLLAVVPRVLLVGFFEAGFGQLSLELFVLKLPVEMGDPGRRAEVGEEFSGFDTLGLVFAVRFHARPETQKDL